MKTRKKFNLKYFVEYVNNYKMEDNISTDSVVKDMLYGIGVATNGEWIFADGFRKFKQYLKDNIL